MDTNGGVFGSGGTVGFGSVLPDTISDEGFEDLGGPLPPGSAYQPPLSAASMPMPPMGAAPPRVARAPGFRVPAQYPMMGMGQEAMVMPAPAPSCSKVGPTLAGFVAGAVTVGLGWGVYAYFSHKG